MITLTKAYGHNFLLYKNIELPLNNQGLVCLTGHDITNTAKSNGKGKTSLLSLIPYVVWGRLFRDLKDVSGVIRHGQEATETKLEGLIKDEPFTIERNRTRKGQTELKFSLGGSSRKGDVQVEINQYFGTFDMARNTVLLDSKTTNEFYNAGDATRRKLLEDLLKLAVWRDGLRRLESDKTDEPNIAWTKLEMARVTTASEKAAQRLKEIRVEQKHAKELEASSLEARKKLLTEQLVKRKREYGEALSTSKKLSEVDHTYNAIVSATKSDIARRKDGLKNYNNDLLIIKKSLDLSTDNCPTCGQPLPQEQKLSKTELNQHKAKYDQILKSRDIALEDIKKLEEKLEQQRKEASLKSAEATSANQVVRQKQKEVVALELEIASLNSLIEEAKNKPDDLYLEKIEELQFEIKKRGDQLAILDEDLKVKLECQKALHYKGIAARRINRALPLLTRSTNEILDVMSEGSLRISITPADVARTDGRLLDRLTFIVWDEGRQLFLEEVSEGQKKRIVVSLFLGFSKLQQELTGVSWNCLLLDEIFDGLDGPGIECALRVLSEMRSRPTIIVTSHRSELADLEAFQSQWRVTRDRGGCSILSMG